MKGCATIMGQIGRWAQGHSVTAKWAQGPSVTAAWASCVPQESSLLVLLGHAEPESTAIFFTCRVQMGSLVGSEQLQPAACTLLLVGHTTSSEHFLGEFGCSSLSLKLPIGVLYL